MRTVSIKKLADLNIKIKPEDRVKILRPVKKEPQPTKPGEKLAEAINEMARQLVDVSRETKVSLEIITRVLAETLQIVSKNGEQEKRKPMNLKIKFVRDGSRLIKSAKITEA
uniref:Uncharacterized protein n=1 Tax=viral metagenome TaxID=1070528 RepID=A0A6M3KGT7_9ZZZZ